MIVFTKAILYLFDRGWVAHINRWIIFGIRYLIGLVRNNMYSNKFTRIVWALALLNLALLAWWGFINIDFLRVFREVTALIYNFVMYITDARAIVVSFLEVLRALQIKPMLLFIKTKYIHKMIEFIYAGDLGLLFWVPVVSIVLGLIGFIPTALSDDASDGAKIFAIIVCTVFVFIIAALLK